MKIVYVHPSNGKDVRVQKSLETLKELCEEVHFIGWVRSSQLQEDNIISDVIYHFHHSNNGFGLKSAVGLPLFWLFINKIIKKIKPNIIVFANEENAFFNAIMKKKDIILVCDIHDSVADRVKNKWACLVAPKIRDIVNYKMDYLIFTDEMRLQRLPEHNNKSFVIYNAPKFNEVNFIPKYSDYLYYSGSISCNRGFYVLMKALSYLKDKYNLIVPIIAAGVVNDEEIMKVIEKQKEFHYLGHISFKESLEITNSALGVFSYYDPIVINNIYASPNKLYECMMMQKPILINNETLVSNYVLEKNLGLCGTYDDYVMLAENIKTLVLKQFIPENNVEEFRKKFSWDNAQNVYTSIIGPKNYIIKKKENDL